MTVRDLLETHPLAPADENALLGRTIDVLGECAATCIACADACLAEEGVEGLRRCIALNLDCADVCAAAERVLVRRSYAEPDLETSILLACAKACRRCAEECERHAEHHEHCRLCAESCRRCVEVCEEAVASLTL